MRGDVTNFTFVGKHGGIILEFADNALTTCGDNNLDLYVVENGTGVPVKVYISSSNTNWIEVGEASDKLY